MCYDEVEKGLADRGFVGIEGMDSMGECHTPDEKHYILRTDGLLIYSNVPYWHEVRSHPQYLPSGSVYEMWTHPGCCGDDDDCAPDDLFTWEKLDKYLK